MTERNGNSGMASARDLLLEVQESRVKGNRRRLSFQGYSSLDPDLGPAFDQPEETLLKRSPDALLPGLYRSIEALVRRPKEAKRLEALGVRWFKMLIPYEIRRWLWHHATDPARQTLQIRSNETWVPWELLKLRDPDRNSSGPFLAEAFELTRWLQGCPRQLTLPLRTVALVASAGVDKGATETEIKALEEVLGGDRSTRVASTYQAVTLSLGEGTYDGWHFATHGVAQGKNPDHWEVLLDEGRLEAVDLSGEASGFAARRPLIFLNACHSGKGGASLTGLGGFVSAFLRPESKKGAGAFIGTLWTVDSAAAKRFAEVFYDLFLRGVEIGEAVRRARQEVRREFPADPSWLAYFVYAHPRAACLLKPASRPVGDLDSEQTRVVTTGTPVALPAESPEADAGAVSSKIKTDLGSVAESGSGNQVDADDFPNLGKRKAASFVREGYSTDTFLGSVLFLLLALWGIFLEMFLTNDYLAAAFDPIRISLMTFSTLGGAYLALQLSRVWSPRKRKRWRPFQTWSCLALLILNVAIAARLPPPVITPLDALGIPVGWMPEGDPSSFISLTTTDTNCRGTTDCLKIGYRPGGGWGGIYWWPSKCGAYGTAEAWNKVRLGICGVNVTNAGGFQDAKRLTFWARGDNGGENIEFKIGGHDIEPTPGRSIGKKVLTQKWRRYQIDLDGVDVTRAIGLFAWVAADLDNPRGATFYLDEIQFEGVK